MRPLGECRARRRKTTHCRPRSPSTPAALVSSLSGPKFPSPGRPEFPSPEFFSAWLPELPLTPPPRVPTDPHPLTNQFLSEAAKENFLE